MLPDASRLPSPSRKLLREVIESFTPRARASGWATRTGARGHCGQASMEFMHVLDAAGLPNELAYWNDVSCGRYPYRPASPIDHNAVRVGDVVIDWTARQFAPDAPFPAIWFDDASVFDERIEIPVARLDFQVSGSTLWVCDETGRTVLRVTTNGITAVRSTGQHPFIDIRTNDPLFVRLPKKDLCQ